MGHSVNDSQVAEVHSDLCTSIQSKFADKIVMTLEEKEGLGATWDDVLSWLGCGQREGYQNYFESQSPHIRRKDFCQPQTHERATQDDTSEGSISDDSRRKSDIILVECLSFVHWQSSLSMPLANLSVSSPLSNTRAPHNPLHLLPSIRHRLLHHWTRCTSLGYPSIVANQASVHSSTSIHDMETYASVHAIPDPIGDCIVCPMIPISSLMLILNPEGGVYTFQIRTQMRTRHRGRHSSFGRGNYMLIPISINSLRRVSL